MECGATFIYAAQGNKVGTRVKELRASPQQGKAHIVVAVASERAATKD